MRIIRSHHESDFTILPNSTVRDPRLYHVARSVLHEILSRPSGWETSADRMVEQAKRDRAPRVGEGRRAIRQAFAELEAAGYMHRVKQRGQDGRWTTVIIVYDTPQDRRTGSGTSGSGMSGSGTSASGTSL